MPVQTSAANGSSLGRSLGDDAGTLRRGGDCSTEYGSMNVTSRRAATSSCEAYVGANELRDPSRDAQDPALDDKGDGEGTQPEAEDNREMAGVSADGDGSDSLPTGGQGADAEGDSQSRKGGSAVEFELESERASRTKAKAVHVREPRLQPLDLSIPRLGKGMDKLSVKELKTELLRRKQPVDGNRTGATPLHAGFVFVFVPSERTCSSDVFHIGPRRAG